MDAQETREIALGTLKEKLVTITPGQKIAYITDTVYSPTNIPRIVNLVREADLFFCESPFIAEEEDRARDRCHLDHPSGGPAGERGWCQTTEDLPLLQTPFPPDRATGPAKHRKLFVVNRTK